MTLPDERYRAVLWAKRFLQDLAYNSKDYPRISKKVRGEAHSILRHFPSEYDMNKASQTSPDVFAEKMEPVIRLMAQYEESKKNGQEA